MSMRMLSWSLAGVIAMGALVGGCDPGLQTGQVLFTTNNTINRMGGCTCLAGVLKSCDHGGTGNECSMANAVASVGAGTDVYAVYILTGRVPSPNRSRDAAITVTRDGVPTPCTERPSRQAREGRFHAQSLAGEEGFEPSIP